MVPGTLLDLVETFELEDSLRLPTPAEAQSQIDQLQKQLQQ